MIPDHVCYVEPFCGAAHVFFRKPPSKIEILNDLDGELMNFFRCAQTVPEAVARSLAAMPRSRRLHSVLKRLDLDCLDPIQRAARFAYLVQQSFGGLPAKGFSSAKQKGGRGTRSSDAISDAVRACAAHLDRTTLECLDWQECLDKYDAPTTFFYLDPPYLGADVGYKHNLSEEDHRHLAERLKKLRGKWLLTIGDSVLMRELYRGYPRRQISTAQSLKKGSRDHFRELIVRGF